MISVAYATSTIVVDTVKPDIKATFNETVTLDSFELTYAADLTSIPLDYTSQDNMTFFFTPQQSLPNGFYYFVVTAQDRIGNPKEFRQNVLVQVNETKIYFISPFHGISQMNPFDLTLGTTRTANCRWSYDNVNYSAMSASSFSQTGDTVHKIVGYTSPLPSESTITMYVKCLDELGIIVKQELVVGYDSTPPSISSSVSQNPVKTYPPQTTITINSNDESICFINGLPFTGQDRNTASTYSFSPKNTIEYPATTASNGQYTYNVYCENLAGAPVSLIPSLTITVALQEVLSIVSVNSPAAFIRNPLTYSIVTNKEANCSATLDGANKTTLSRDATKTMHSFVQGQVSQGQHIVKFLCIGGTESAESIVPFVVDDTPPSQIAVNASACSPSQLSLSFSAVDNQSGIYGFNYSVSGGNVSLNWTFIVGTSTQRSGLSLVQGSTYSIQATATNKAGGISPVSTSTFIFSPNTTVACQEKIPPTLTLNITDAGFGKRVKINCFDASGCIQSSIKYGLSSGANCTPTIASTETIVQKQQTMCYEGQDIYFNKATGSQLIQVKTVGNTCSNGFLDGTETDLDCGGSCLSCSIGLKCSINADCTDNYCSSGICTKSSCNDTIKNGFETAVDCGGPSCGKCNLGKTCSINSDCSSNSCSSGVCGTASCTDGIQNGFETGIDCGGSVCNACPGEQQTFEQWAKENNIDPADQDGDADKDGLSNFEEYKHGTNPNKADTDGDGYSDFDEVNAGTNPLDIKDFPVSFLYRNMLLAIGVIALLVGILFMYYFRVDSQTSINIAVIGAVSLLIVIIDWLLYKIPNSVLAVLFVASLGGTGYLAYQKKQIIVERLSGRPALRLQQARKPGESRSESRVIVQETKKEPPLTREELSATKQMIEMIKREKSERERHKEAVFEEFGTGKKIPEKIVSGKKILEPLTKPKKIEKTKPVEKQEFKKNAFDRLTDISSKDNRSMERLGHMGRQGTGVADLERLQKKQDAFEKLSGIMKSGIESIENVFSKLPSPEKKIETKENKKEGKKKKR